MSEPERSNCRWRRWVLWFYHVCFSFCFLLLLCLLGTFTPQMKVVKDASGAPLSFPLQKRPTVLGRYDDGEGWVTAAQPPLPTLRIVLSRQEPLLLEEITFTHPSWPQPPGGSPRCPSWSKEVGKACPAPCWTILQGDECSRTPSVKQTRLPRPHLPFPDLYLHLSQSLLSPEEHTQ